MGLCTFKSTMMLQGLKPGKSNYCKKNKKRRNLDKLVIKIKESEIFGILREKNPDPGYLEFFGIIPSRFFSEKQNPESPGFMIWELGSRKKPISKQSLIHKTESLFSVDL